MCIKNVDLFLQNPPIDSFSKDGKTPSSLNGNIEFRNIHFKYPSRPDVPVSLLDTRFKII